MEIIFLGVGEACDEKHCNTAMLVTVSKHDLPRHILLECGFQVPFRLWDYNADQELLDIVYLSHFHGDHSFGLPALLLRMWEASRKKKLILLGQKGLQSFVHSLMELAYPGMIYKLPFDVQYVEGIVTERILGIDFALAQTAHSVCNLAVAIECFGKKMAYSGDGKVTVLSKQLFLKSDLLVHEAFMADGVMDNHESMDNVLAVANQAGVKRLALVHIQRQQREICLRQGLPKIIEDENMKSNLGWIRQGTNIKAGMAVEIPQEGRIIRL